MAAAIYGPPPCDIRQTWRASQINLNTRQQQRAANSQFSRTLTFLSEND